MGALRSERPERGGGGRTVGAVDDHPQSLQRRVVPKGSDEVGDVALNRTQVGRDTPHGGAHGSRPGLAHPGLDRVLEVVVELDAAPGEELDAVVGHGVVRRRDHDAEVSVHVVDQESHRGGGHDTEPHDVDTGRREARDDGGLKELAAGPGVAPHERHRPVPGERPCLAQDVCGCDRQVESHFSGEFDVRDATDAVSTKESCHER